MQIPSENINELHREELRDHHLEGQNDRGLSPDAAWQVGAGGDAVAADIRKAGKKERRSSLLMAQAWTDNAMRRVREIMSVDPAGGLAMPALIIIVKRGAHLYFSAASVSTELSSCAQKVSQLMLEEQGLQKLTTAKSADFHLKVGVYGMNVDLMRISDLLLLLLSWQTGGCNSANWGMI